MSALLGYLLIANLAAFAAMGWDKSSARRGVERIPERTLLTLAAAGGGLGAVLAQQVFRHKTRKQPFANILVAIFAAQAVLAIFLMSRS
ncbi:DUF1294 domain-containing protein, partial [Phenylobacterium sp. Root700]|uniref:DUF1294 domain-containing protein n=2 Tax=unclassified Phenylobacterium TaxID=2640670 RepID=UPI001F1D0465